MQFSTYESSGRSGHAWIIIPLLGLPIIALLSLIYSYIVVYSPIGGVLTIFIMAGYIFGVGLTVSILGKWAKCRNVMTMRVLGLGCGAVGLWLSWVFVVYALINRSAGEHVGVMDLMLQPEAMWVIIGEVASTGWYTIKNLTPSGLVLWSLWAIEAVAVIGGAIFLATSGITQEMFCETCDAWCPVKETKYLQIDQQLSRAKLEGIDIMGLFTLPSSDAKIMPSIRTELVECLACKLTKGIRFIRLTETTDKEGKVTEKSENLPGIHIPPTAG